MPPEIVSVDKAHGTPLEIQISGKTYKVGRTRLADLAALQERIRDRRIAALLRNRVQIASPEVFSKTLAALIATDPTEVELWNTMLSHQGSIFLAWRGLNRYHPEVTEEQFAEWVDNNPQLTSLILGESGLTAPAGEVDPTANPTPALQSTGSKTPQCFAGNAASDSTKSPNSNGLNTAA